MQVMAQTNTREATMAAVAVLTHSRGQAAQPGPPIIPTKEPYHIIAGCGLVPDTRCDNSIFAASCCSANISWRFTGYNRVSDCLLLSVHQILASCLRSILAKSACIDPLGLCMHSPEAICRVILWSALCAFLTPCHRFVHAHVRQVGCWCAGSSFLICTHRQQSLCCQRLRHTCTRKRGRPS